MPSKVTTLMLRTNWLNDLELSFFFNVGKQWLSISSLNGVMFSILISQINLVVYAYLLLSFEALNLTLHSFLNVTVLLNMHFWVGFNRNISELVKEILWFICEYSICNNIWSDSKLNFHNEGENTSFTLNLHFWLSSPLPSKWERFSLLHCPLCSVLRHFIPQGSAVGCPAGEHPSVFLLHCNIPLGSNWCEKKIHEAADCFIQSHLWASDKYLLHRPSFHF